jgi:DNA-binding MarR family transcriptional regulator
MIGALLRIPFQATVARVHAGLVARGYRDLRPAHLVVFQHLEPGGSRQTYLAERGQLTKQSMGYLIDYLEERGYLARVPDSRDGRARLVVLTDRGRAVEQAARAELAVLEAEWDVALGGRLDVLRNLLRELVDALER